MKNDERVYRENEFLMPLEDWELFSDREKSILRYGEDEEIEKIYREKLPEILVEKRNDNIVQINPL